MDRTNIEKHLFKDDYIDISFQRYYDFKKSNTYDEGYKLEVLSELNSYLSSIRISEDNIIEVIGKLRSSNPTEGSFVHWSNTDDLYKFASSEPTQVATLLNNLYYNSNDSISIRIEQFRNKGKEFKNNISLGAPLFGYLLAAYDYKKYPLYKEEVFKDIKKVFGINRKLGSVSENYLFYYDICEATYLYLLSKGFSNSMLDVQDFFFCLTQYDQPKVESAVEYIHAIAKKIDYFSKNDEVFLNTIEQLDREDLVKSKEIYHKATKINKIRFRLLEQILENNKLNIAELEKIKREVNDENEKNILQAWTNFTILFQIYYDSIKEKVYHELATIHQAIRKIDGVAPIEFEENKVINGFNWNQNFGGSESWLAVIPTNKKSHKVAAQLFVSIDERAMRFGLLYGSEHPNRGKESLTALTNIKDFKYENMKAKFREVFPIFVEDNDIGVEAKEDITPSAPLEVEGIRYFWLTANPTIWSVENIKDGGAVNYTAFNEKGNKRRIFSAFENAQPGDKIIIYESTPRREVVAQGEVVEGLHV